MPLGLVLILIGADSPHEWMVPAGIGLLAISVIDIAFVFPLMMMRASRQRDREH